MTNIQTIYKSGMLNEAQAGALDALLHQLTSQQALWISGYIAGLHAAQPVTGDIANRQVDTLVPVTILYASETGNARALSEHFAEALSGQHFAARYYAMDEYPKRQLKDETCVLVIASTHGEGDTPNHAKDFYEFLNSRKAPKLKMLKYAVLGLGDSSYEFFCQAAKDIDQRLAELGAQRLHDRIDCDVDYETDSSNWLNTLLPTLKPFQADAATPSVQPHTNTGNIHAVKQSIFSKKNPFPAPLIERLHLNGRGASKQTLHLELDLQDSGLEYQPGDALGVLPKNNITTVDRLCKALGFSDDDPVTYNKKQYSLQHCLTEKLDITTVTRHLLKNWQAWTGNDTLHQVLSDQKDTYTFCYQHHVEDLIRQYPVKDLTVQQFVDTLRPIQPRLYSISSCLDAYPDEVHLTVAKVTYTLHGRHCIGTASGYLSDSELEAPVPIYVQANPNFKLPTNPDTPIIMIGAGTGIAPYRGFLQSLEANGRQCQSWLFFGDRHFRTDFLYQTEWQQYLKQGVLTKMNVAFSRDQSEKIYVQHKMLEQAKSLYAWLEEGAVVYVCGDAKRLAPDVHTTLKTIIKQQRACSEEDADAYFKALRQNKRYLQDVY